MHGPVRVANRVHFDHADGTACHPFGTTCYARTHQPLAMQEETMQTLAKTDVNKIRMAVFPKDYPFNQNEPLQPVYQPTASGFDFDTPNFAAFRHFETQVGGLAEMGIETHVMVSVEGADVSVVLKERQSVPVGARVTLAIDTARTHLFDAAAGMRLPR